MQNLNGCKQELCTDKIKIDLSKEKESKEKYKE